MGLNGSCEMCYPNSGAYPTKKVEAEYEHDIRKAYSKNKYKSTTKGGSMDSIPGQTTLHTNTSTISTDGFDYQTVLIKKKIDSPTSLKHDKTVIINPGYYDSDDELKLMEYEVPANAEHVRQGTVPDNSDDDVLFIESDFDDDNEIVNHNESSQLLNNKYLTEEWAELFETDNINDKNNAINEFKTEEW
eukprot:CAMPEP_0114664630 /NCGR_PEP_ID=MMETSP0191-20121206/29157_1 /TAXON_ID=126664 /ORGANISM="Sorites sp." /LENGTH=188 /DNA_ID=CAMNT_0001907279 /DNA_START=56 /DNA_END=619 /DNA_ORIENTATION=+